MPFESTCPQCGNTQRYDDSLVGKLVVCLRCGTKNVVPSSSSDSALVDPAALRLARRSMFYGYASLGSLALIPAGLVVLGILSTTNNDAVAFWSIGVYWLLVCLGFLSSVTAIGIGATALARLKNAGTWDSARRAAVRGLILGTIACASYVFLAAVVLLIEVWH
jgi:hypothetical protein